MAISDGPSRTRAVLSRSDATCLPEELRRGSFYRCRRVYRRQRRYTHDHTGDDTPQTSGSGNLTASNGPTTARMSNPANFIGWDFRPNGTWTIPWAACTRCCAGKWNTRLRKCASRARARSFFAPHAFGRKRPFGERETCRFDRCGTPERDRRATGTMPSKPTFINRR
jgi:hypothetical protein